MLKLRKLFVPMALVGPALLATGAAGVASGAPATTLSGQKAAVTSAAVPNRPNIVFILTDDQTLSMMSALPKTKNLIVNAGTTFDYAENPLPLCCPARATLLTGQYPHNHGVMANQGADGGFDALDNTNTYAKWLHNAGYKTVQVGKYLNGYNKHKTEPLGWDDWWALSKNPFLMWDYTINHNGTEITYGSSASEYKTDVLTKLAVDYIHLQAGSSQPFYLSLWYNAPHVEQGTDFSGKRYNDPPRPAPRDAGLYSDQPLPADPSINEADVSDKPRWIQSQRLLGASGLDRLRKRYDARLAALAAVDDGVEAVYNALSDAGKFGNTILVFTSDNGTMHGEHRITFGKQTVYEPAVHAPLYAWGAGWPAGAHVSTPVSFIDVAPTFVQVAGATAGLQMDGTSLYSIMGGALGGDRAIYILSGTDTDKRFRAVHTKRWVYVLNDTGEEELYDLKTDPFELNSRHNDPTLASIKATLVGLMNQLNGCKGSACNVAVPPSLT